MQERLKNVVMRGLFQEAKLQILVEYLDLCKII